MQVAGMPCGAPSSDATRPERDHRVIASSLHLQLCWLCRGNRHSCCSRQSEMARPAAVEFSYKELADESADLSAKIEQVSGTAALPPAPPLLLPLNRTARGVQTFPMGLCMADGGLLAISLAPMPGLWPRRPGHLHRERRAQVCGGAAGAAAAGGAAGGVARGRQGGAGRPRLTLQLWVGKLLLLACCARFQLMCILQ